MSGATCESNGHLWNMARTCIMCGAPRPTQRITEIRDLLVGQRVLVLETYCGGDNPDCTEAIPCRDCMDLCDVATITEATVADFDPDCIGHQRVEQYDNARKPK